MINEQQTCNTCGREFFEQGDEKLVGRPCPAVDDCPSHWEEKGLPHPCHPDA